jgi:hypothetical protein
MKRIGKTNYVDILVIMAIGEARIVADGNNGMGDRDKQEKDSNFNNLAVSIKYS